MVDKKQMDDELRSVAKKNYAYALFFFLAALVSLGVLVNVSKPLAVAVFVLLLGVAWGKLIDFEDADRLRRTIVRRAILRMEPTPEEIAQFMRLSGRSKMREKDSNGR